MTRSGSLQAEGGGVAWDNWVILLAGVLSRSYGRENGNTMGKYQQEVVVIWEKKRSEQKHTTDDHVLPPFTTHIKILKNGDRRRKCHHHTTNYVDP